MRCSAALLDLAAPSITDIYNICPFNRFVAASADQEDRTTGVTTVDTLGIRSTIEGDRVGIASGWYRRDCQNAESGIAPRSSLCRRGPTARPVSWQIAKRGIR